ncbi:MAG: DbpA RNA binding domain-containing protein, partial [Endomicrobium sp.]|nr:DbpA RNA binding domain-containing protein [Endomicrobium sp.]
IAGEAGIDGDMVGNIKILESFSFVEVPSKHADAVINALHSSNIKGKRVFVEFAKARNSSDQRTEYSRRGHANYKTFRK